MLPAFQAGMCGLERVKHGFVMQNYIVSLKPVLTHGEEKEDLI